MMTDSGFLFQRTTRVVQRQVTMSKRSRGSQSLSRMETPSKTAATRIMRVGIQVCTLAAPFLLRPHLWCWIFGAIHKVFRGV